MLGVIQRERTSPRLTGLLKFDEARLRRTSSKWSLCPWSEANHLNWTAVSFHALPITGPAISLKACVPHAISTPTGVHTSQASFGTQTLLCGISSSQICPDKWLDYRGSLWSCLRVASHSVTYIVQLPNVQKVYPPPVRIILHKMFSSTHLSAWLKAMQIVIEMCWRREKRTFWDEGNL